MFSTNLTNRKSEVCVDAVWLSDYHSLVINDNSDPKQHHSFQFIFHWSLVSEHYHSLVLDLALVSLLFHFGIPTPLTTLFKTLALAKVELKCRIQLLSSTRRY